MESSKAAAVLVVDDDKAVCKIISAALADKGFETAVVYNGKEALDYLKSTSRQPGLILLDLMMPEMTGWEFRKIQQEDPVLARIPVAIITGMEDADGKFSAMGAVDVLCKPSKVEEVASLVSRFCKEKGGC
jgi:CheY-like chemotaxis protein